MRRRHPHLFELGDAEPWEHIKRRERKGHVLGGLSPTLPSLLMACRLQERLRRWASIGQGVEGPLDKVREELAEVEEELRASQSRALPPGRRPQRSRTAAERAAGGRGGGPLFAVVNLARKAGFRPVWRWIEPIESSVSASRESSGWLPNEG